MAVKLRVTLVRSPISHTSRTRGNLRALGLHRLGETVELPDTPQMRGMTRAVRFLLQTEEIAVEVPSVAKGATRPAAKAKAAAAVEPKGTRAALPEGTRAAEPEATSAAESQATAAVKPKAAPRRSRKKEASEA